MKQILKRIFGIEGIERSIEEKRAVAQAAEEERQRAEKAAEEAKAKESTATAGADAPEVTPAPEKDPAKETTPPGEKSPTDLVPKPPSDKKPISTIPEPDDTPEMTSKRRAQAAIDRIMNKAYGTPLPPSSEVVPADANPPASYYYKEAGMTPSFQRSVNQSNITGSDHFDAGATNVG